MAKSDEESRGPVGDEELGAAVSGGSGSETGTGSGSEQDHEGAKATQVVRRLRIGRVEGDLRIRGRSALGLEVDPAPGGDNAPTVTWHGSDVVIDSPVGCEISVPGSASIEVREVEGSLRIKGVAGDVTIGVVGREVALKNVGPTRIETVGERLKVRGMAGDLNASTIGGSAVVEAVAGAVRLATVGGSLDLSGVRGEVAASVGGSARIDRTPSSEGPLRITAGGSIECTVPEDVAADIRAAAGGIVRIDLHEIDLAGGVQHYAGAVGGGGASIELTAGGTIRIQGVADGPPRVAFEHAGEDADFDVRVDVSGARRGATEDADVDRAEREHGHVRAHAHAHAHDDEHGRRDASGRDRRRDAAEEAWDWGADSRWEKRVGDFETDISRLVREAAGRLDGLAVEINASVAEALASLPSALESAGLSEDRASRLAIRLQRIGERATERAERQIKRAMHRAEREVGRAGRRAGEAAGRRQVRLRKVIKTRPHTDRSDGGQRRQRAGAPGAPASGTEVRQVLSMLEAGTITADQAARLIEALESPGREGSDGDE